MTPKWSQMIPKWSKMTPKWSQIMPKWFQMLLGLDAGPVPGLGPGQGLVPVQCHLCLFRVVPGLGWSRIDLNMPPHY